MLITVEHVLKRGGLPWHGEDEDFLKEALGDGLGLLDFCDLPELYPGDKLYILADPDLLPEFYVLSSITHKIEEKIAFFFEPPYLEVIREHQAKTGLLLTESTKKNWLETLAFNNTLEAIKEVNSALLEINKPRYDYFFSVERYWKFLEKAARALSLEGLRKSGALEKNSLGFIDIQNNALINTYLDFLAVFREAVARFVATPTHEGYLPKDIY